MYLASGIRESYTSAIDSTSGILSPNETLDLPMTDFFPPTSSQIAFRGGCSHVVPPSTGGWACAGIIRHSDTSGRAQGRGEGQPITGNGNVKHTGNKNKSKIPFLHPPHRLQVQVEERVGERTHQDPSFAVSL